MADMKFLAIKYASIVLSIISIIGNALVCHIIVRVKSMKTSMNYIMLNLAVLDAMNGFIAIFFTLANAEEDEFGPPLLKQAYHESSMAAEVICKIKWGLWLGTNISSFLLLGMAYERYKAIVHPLSRLRGIAIKKVVQILCFSWFAGIVTSAFDVATATFDSTGDICKHQNTTWFDERVYHSTMLVGIYIIPAFIISFLYLRVILTLRQQDRSLGTQGEDQRARAKARKRVIIVVIAATATFFICTGISQTLYHVFTIARKVINPTETRLFHEIFVLLVAFNSAFNPFAYFMFIKPFRHGFKIAFKLKQHDPNAMLNLNQVNVLANASRPELKVNKNTNHEQPQQPCLPLPTEGASSG